jgi:hypothetical protein
LRGSHVPKTAITDGDLILRMAGVTQGAMLSLNNDGV